MAPGYDTVEKTKKDAFLALLGDSDSTEYKIFFGGADISEMDIEELDSKVRKIGMLYDDKILTETSGFSAKDQFYQYIQEQN